MPRRPALAAIAALLCLLAPALGCGQTAPGEEAEGTVRYGDPEAPAPDAGAPPAPTPTSGRAAGADGPPDDGREGRSPTTRAPSSGGPAGSVPDDRSHLGPPGAFAARLLQPAPRTRLVVEVFQQSGAGPRAASMEHALSRLGRVSGKPVTAAGPTPVDGGARPWTADELRRLADQGATVAQGGEVAAIRILFVHGTFGGNDQVLGVAVRGDVIAIFVDRVAAAETPLVGRGEIEKAVVLHEIGHVLGLVGLVVNAERQDPDHPGHSRNRESVMYWAVESSLVTQVLSGGPPTEFDADDLADLAAIRNGAG